MEDKTTKEIFNSKVDKMIMKKKIDDLIKKNIIKNESMNLCKEVGIDYIDNE